MATSTMNRELWLSKLADELRADFSTAGKPLPSKIRFTCGWPSHRAMSRRNRVIGECWKPDASKDKTIEIFISPCLGDGLAAAETLAHELVHASGCYGHKKEFSTLAAQIGLVKPWRATKAGPALQERLNGLIKKLGAYPHAELDKTQAPYKKDGTRMLKVVCESCGYTVRTTAKWIEQGLPICPCGTEMTA